MKLLILLILLIPLPTQAPEAIIEPVEAIVETKVRTTCYLWTGNPMANGKYPEYGYVATSDRTIPFGTEIIIDGETFIVGDRTNKRFQHFDIPTIDIYWEGSREGCLSYGVKYKNVIIKL